MQAIEGARLIPGAHVDDSPSEEPRSAGDGKLLRGKAVIVCGAAMGDIFRRNALNLGLTVIQSRQAVDDAQEGDAFSFDPVTRKLNNETRGKSYEPTELSPQEEEIRRSGGIIKIGRREF